MKIQESAENYPKTMLILAKRQSYVHSVDITTELGFSEPSVNVATKNLRQNGYVQMGGQGHIALTPSRQTTTDAMCEHRTLLSSWLTYLGVDPKAVAEDTCRMEHTLSAKSSDAIKCHITHDRELPD